MKTCVAQLAWLSAAMLSPLATPAVAQETTPPLRFEIQIDGESYLVDEGRATKLTHPKDPGRTYQVAVRLAEYQPWQLNTLGFTYHRGFELQDDRNAQLRTATLKHDLGFALVLSDMGGPLDEEGKQAALKLLVEATERSLQASGAANIEVGAPSNRKFGKTEGRGVVINYQQGDVAQRALAYMLTGEAFAATAVVQYVQEDQADVLDMITPTFASLTALPAAP